MMNWLSRNKFNGIAIVLIFVGFIFSVLVRQSNLNTPLEDKEWITAHTLITAEIWEENGGPSAFGFNPIYNYPGEGNAYRTALGGVDAANGEVYYVSYPPFAFLFYYYASQLMGGQSIWSIRVISLMIHLITALLLFFFVRELTAKKGEVNFPYGPLIAAGLYLFARGNLWFHANLYFADTVIQPLFIGALLCAVRYKTGNYKKEKRILTSLFVLFFLACYTEWLGLLAAFIAGCAFLLLSILKKDRKLLRPFLIIGTSAIMALSLTLVQYTSIDGWENLKTKTTKKFTERSGYDNTVDSAKTFNIHNGDTFDFMRSKFDNNYKRIENYLGFTAGFFILLLIIRKLYTKGQITVKTESKTIQFALFILICPVLLHYIILFNFNALHEFSGLKTSAIIVILCGLLIEASLTNAAQIKPILKTSSIYFFSLLLILKIVQNTRSYWKEYAPDKRIDYARIESAKQMGQELNPNTAAFSNLSLIPSLIYYSKHIYAPLDSFDLETIRNIMLLRRNEYGEYFQHEDAGLVYKIELKLVDQHIEILDTIHY